jgi:hypothetical protein
MKTTSANERPAAAEMAATPTTPREHGGSSERNNHGKSCKRRGDFPEVKVRIDDSFRSLV